MRSIRPVVTLLGLFTLVTSVGCGGNDTPAAGDAASAPAGAALEKAAGTPGESLPFVRGELPKGYPSDLPPYPGSTPALSMLVPGEGGLVTFTSSDGDREVFDFYTEQLPAQGWEVDASNEQPFWITTSKGERKAVIKISRSGEETSIAISLEGV